MKYLAVLGRQPEISIAELSALFHNVRQISAQLATFDSDTPPSIDRLGGTIKLAEKIAESPIDFLSSINNKKIIFGLSNYNTNASARSVFAESLKLKKILTCHGHSVRVITAKSPILPTATSLHNGLSGKNPHKVELIKFNNDWHRVIGIQDIDAYTARDQARPARDAKVGMLPPKLAQILINLCGPLPAGSRLLDPFCGTGVILQEALLMGYHPYGTDINPRMIEYSEKNLRWLNKKSTFVISVGDAASFTWEQPIDAVACEAYLGRPMLKIPTDIELKREKQFCEEIILKFLKNLAPQIKKDTPVVIAIPAWLNDNHTYSRLLILDLLPKLGYNVNNTSREGLLYHRDDQIVARDIIIMRKI